VVAIAHATGAITGGDAGDDPTDDYEYRPLRIDSSTSRSAAAVMLSVRAEFTGWELARVLRFPDGSRRVTLRRKRSAGPVPALSL
jgi:hypothetical protein